MDVLGSKSALNPKARKKDPALTDLLLQIMQDINDDWGEKAVCYLETWR